MKRTRSGWGLVLGASLLCACGGNVQGSGAGGTGGGSPGTGGADDAGGAAGAGGSAGVGGGSGGVAGSGGAGPCIGVMPGICCDKSGRVDPQCAPGLGGYDWVCPAWSSHVDAAECPATPCSPSMPCSAKQWCDYGSNHCGQFDETGTCTLKPDGCPDIYQPVCGCDGVVHGNECDAHASGVSSGVDVSGDELCAPPGPDMFPCGQLFCRVAEEYCQVFGSDIGGWPDEFSCQPLPAPCSVAQPDCSCLANETCGWNCAWNVQYGGYKAICPGG